jgi:rRNA pseudouridine-1189 N-methylase Emg1 (Nep1/Mra1 family)
MVVEVNKEPNVPETLKLFVKLFEYLFNGDYISPQQKAEYRRMAKEQGLISKEIPHTEQ